MITINRQALDERMIRQGYTKAGLARAAGISKGYVSQVLNCKRQIMPPIAKKICETLACSFDDIFSIQKEVKNNDTATHEDAKTSAQDA